MALENDELLEVNYSKRSAHTKMIPCALEYKHRSNKSTIEGEIQYEHKEVFKTRLSSG